MSRLLLPAITGDIPADGLSIGQAAAVTGVGIQTLRYYEREGLMLDPTPRDAGNRRRYTHHDLAWIAGLVMLRETGMPIAEMRVIADLSRRANTEDKRLAFFEKHRATVIAQLEKTTRHLAAIDKKIADYRRIAAQEDHR